MNNELTESENALNCIIENYVNELQRNTCDDDEEDMRIYQEKMDYITSQKEIVLKDLEDYEELKSLMETPIQDIMKRLKILDILKPYCHLVYDDINHEWHFIIGYEEIDEDYFKNEVDLVVSEEEANKIKEWLDGK